MTNDMVLDRPEIDAPYNTPESADDYNIYDFSTDEDILNQEENPLKGLDKEDPNWFDINLLNSSPFRIESVKYFPHKAREGEIPLRLLKEERLELLIESGVKIQEEQKEEKWSVKFL